MRSPLRLWRVALKIGKYLGKRELAKELTEKWLDTKQSQSSKEKESSGSG